MKHYEVAVHPVIGETKTQQGHIRTKKSAPISLHIEGRDLADAKSRAKKLSPDLVITNRRPVNGPMSKLGEGLVRKINEQPVFAEFLAAQLT